MTTTTSESSSFVPRGDKSDKSADTCGGTFSSRLVPSPQQQQQQKEEKEILTLLLSSSSDDDDSHHRLITPFQRRVYIALCQQVPRGKVTTYQALARMIGGSHARAVGQALKRNPYAPTVPCHRVVKSDGSIGGFGGRTTGPKIQKKIRLLQNEGVRFRKERTTTTTSHDRGRKKDCNVVVVDPSCIVYSFSQQQRKGVQKEKGT